MQKSSFHKPELTRKEVFEYKMRTKYYISLELGGGFCTLPEFYHFKGVGYEFSFLYLHLGFYKY